MDMVENKRTLVQQAEISGVHVNMISRWKTTFVDAGKAALAGLAPPSQGNSDNDQVYALREQCSKLKQILAETMIELSDAKLALVTGATVTEQYSEEEMGDDEEV